MIYLLWLLLIQLLSSIPWAYWCYCNYCLSNFDLVQYLNWESVWVFTIYTFTFQFIIPNLNSLLSVFKIFKPLSHSSHHHHFLIFSVYCNIRERIWISEFRWHGLCDSSRIGTHNHLVCKQTLSHLTILTKWLSAHLQTKWLWIWISLLSLKLQISHLFQARSSLTFRQI